MKRLLIIILILIVILIFLPALLCLSSINQFLLKQYNRTIPGKVHFKELTVSWRQGISVKEVQLDDRTGNVVAKIETLDVKAPLYALLLQSIDLSHFETKGSIDLISDSQNGRFSIESLFGEGSNFFEKDTFDQITSLLGSHIHGTFTISSANVLADLSSQNLTATGKFKFKDDALVLVEPLTGSIKSSSDPIAFRIEQEGFLMPLKSFSLHELEIKSLKIEPGIQKMQSRGLISLILSLLRVKLSSNNSVSLWFTPIYASLSKGRATVQRLDFLLANKYPLAAWGTVDLEKDQVAMTLGVSAEALKQAFFILSWRDNYFVQIPIRGPIVAPQFNLTRATAKITSKRLQQTWSPPTAILGTIMGIASDIGSDDPPVPPPTTTPFPWKK